MTKNPMEPTTSRNNRRHCRKYSRLTKTTCTRELGHTGPHEFRLRDYWLLAWSREYERRRAAACKIGTTAALRGADGAMPRGERT